MIGECKKGYHVDQTPIHPAPPRQKRGRLNKRRYAIRLQALIRGRKREKRRHHRAQRTERARRIAFVAPFGKERRLKVQSRLFLDREIKRIAIPKVFSILDDPEPALETLELIGRAISDLSIRLIQIDHSNCEHLGLCASTAMDVMLLKAKEQRRQGNRLNFGGRMSRNPEVNLMLRASGVLRHLNLPEARLSQQDEARIMRCDLMQGKPNNIEFGKERDVASTKLTDYFDSCLKRLGLELSDEGKKYLSSLLTEVIGNAEEHGGALVDDRTLVLQRNRRAKIWRMPYCHSEFWTNNLRIP